MKPLFLTLSGFALLCFTPDALFAPAAAATQLERQPVSLREYLGLSDTQAQTLDSLQTQRKAQAKSSIQNLEEKQKALRMRLASAGTGDAFAVGKLVLQLELAKNRAEKTSAELRTEALAQLTPVQRAKLRSLEEARQLQPAVREAMVKFLLAPPDSLVSGTGPLGMFTAPKRRGGGGPPPANSVAGLRALSAVPFPNAAQHPEHDQVVKLAME